VNGMADKSLYLVEIIKPTLAIPFSDKLQYDKCGKMINPRNSQEAMSFIQVINKRTEIQVGIICPVLDTFNNVMYKVSFNDEIFMILACNTKSV
jgi:hypothetical protein